MTPKERKEMQAMIKIGLTLCAASIITMAVSDPNLLREIWNWVLTYKGPGQ